MLHKLKIQVNCQLKKVVVLQELFQTEKRYLNLFFDQLDLKKQKNFSIS